MQKGKAGVLHRGLHEETLGKSVDERRRRQTLLDVRFVREEFEVGEQYLDHAGTVDKIGDVSLGDGAPDRLELPADQQILKAEPQPHRLHPVPPVPVWLLRRVAAGRGSRLTQTAGAYRRRRSASHIS